MRGLLVKDFCLLRQRTRFFMMILAIAVFLGISKYDSNIVISYLTILAALFSVSTVSYDEYDNCYCFLMTLPIDRRTYTREKYLFGIILGTSAWLAGAAIHSIALICYGRWAALSQNLADALIYIPMFMIMISLILPFQLKYGAERGRMVMLAVVAGAAALIWALAKMAALAGMGFTKPLSLLAGLDDRQMQLTGFLLAAAVIWISYQISVRIMERKEL